jgi:hypothetical protein
MSSIVGWKQNFIKMWKQSTWKIKIEEPKRKGMTLIQKDNGQKIL